MDDASSVGAKHGRQPPARPGGIALVLGLLLAPTAWFTQTNLAQTLAAWGCFPHDRPLNAPALPWLEHGQLALAACALLAGATGAAIGWRNWGRADTLADELKEQGSMDRRAARDAFIARAGALGSTLFLFGLIAADMAWLLVSPCGGR